eukprot:3205-Heterococcus_DN1.PRE.2
MSARHVACQTHQNRFNPFLSGAFKSSVLTACATLLCSLFHKPDTRRFVLASQGIHITVAAAVL